MNTSFEIIEPPVCDVAQKKHGRQTFSSYVLRRMPLAAASLSVAMTVTSMNCIDMQRQYHPVFIGIESIQNDLSVAFGVYSPIQTEHYYFLLKTNQLRELALAMTNSHMLLMFLTTTKLVAKSHLASTHLNLH